MEHTLSDGRVVPLRRVALSYVDQIRAQHEIPDPPTYSFKAAGGVVVTLPHDEASAEESGPEEKAAWLDYKKARREALAAQEADTLRFLIYQCIDADPPPVDEWSVDHALFGLEPPDPKDKVGFKVAWFERELMTDEGDYAGLVTKLYEMGGLVDSDRAGEFEAIFQLVVERLAAARDRRAARGDPVAGRGR